MKINFACGKQTWPDFYCVDAVRHPKASRAPDLIHVCTFDKDGALVNPLPLADGCADELHSFHFLEHVYAWEAPALVEEWNRLLKSGGRLILELPNIELAARNLVARSGEQMSYWALWGDPGHKDPFMTHRWGYTPDTARALLAQHGFTSIQSLPPRTHGAKAGRDMRIEAVKA